MSNSDLFKNIERSLYTFNFNNIVDICFDKVISGNSLENINKSSKLTQDEKILIDNCIDKYMLSFNIVKDTSTQHLENLFNKKRK
jgi:hypothetical protein